MKRHILFAFFTLGLFLSLSRLCLAAPATVTNNGTVTVRVQYFPTGGTRYEDFGYLKPGETLEVPGGAEKVKITREYGEWARPLREGEVINVTVADRGENAGTMTWFGDKAFFAGPTEARPAPATPAPDVNEQPVAPVETKPTPDVTPAQWPWYSFFDTWILHVLLIFMALPFLVALARSFRNPGWRVDGLYSGYKAQYVLIGLLLGFVLGFWGFWGYGAYGNESGFLPFFSQDVYNLPFFLMVFIARLFGADGHTLIGLMPAPVLVIAFWMLVCAGLGATVGVVRSPILHGMGGVMALMPFLILMRGGCYGPNAYAWQSDYPKTISLYPGAFGSLIVIPLLFIVLLNLVKPYHGYVKSDFSLVSSRSRLGIGCATLIVAFFVAIGLCAFGWWGYSAFAAEGLLGRISTGIVSIPLMLGLSFRDPQISIFLFWPVLICGLVCCSGRHRWGRFLMGGTSVTFIALMILTSSLMMGRDVFRAIDREIYEQYLDMVYDIPALPGDLPDAVLEEYARLRRSGFGDDFGNGHLPDYDSALGGEIGDGRIGVIQLDDRYNDK